MMPASPDLDPHFPTEEVPVLVERLRGTFDSDRTRPLAARKEQLLKLRKMLVEHRDDLLEALAADFGKPPLEAMTSDITFVIQACDEAVRNLERWSRPRKVSTPLMLWPARSRIVPEPLGVVLVIAPWNYPVQLLLAPAVGAIAAGNTVVLKPSEISAHTSHVLATLVPRFLDPEWVAVVEGGVDETRALLEQRFDHIFYTGNGTVGRIVMKAAAEHLTPVTLELGGKSPCIVHETAKLETAARRIAWGKFMNAGQTCVAPDYVLVPEALEEPLVQALARAVRAFYGPDPKASQDYARISSLRHHARLAALLKGQDAAVGGETDLDERYIAPTILRDVSPDADVMSDEIFGPILPILRVRDTEEAIRFVRERDKPLALYVFAEDPAVANDVLARTSSGGACVNGTIFQLVNPALPFGGVGPSGMGAYHGRASFDTFSHQKAVLVRSTWLDIKLMYPPYGRRKTELVKRMS